MRRTGYERGERDGSPITSFLVSAAGLRIHRICSGRLWPKPRLKTEAKETVDESESNGCAHPVFILFLLTSFEPVPTFELLFPINFLLKRPRVRIVVVVQKKLKRRDACPEEIGFHFLFWPHHSKRCFECG